ncbi:unnamed protein product [Candidula unifasciata]|uniref:ELMO domain-containing protein n=1 Tax=Candidula unifasciata TaxID=100452 RepID=A0A8S3Z845_9EUPU|nr:unnamed protein product [Candidula unifasciata]
MDTSADLGVSLDELCIELNEDDNPKPLAAVRYSRDIAEIDVLDLINSQNADNYDTQEVNNTSAHVSTDFKSWSAQEKLILAEPINLEDNTHSSHTVTTSNTNTSTKDDSDSEFEVPDRPLAPPIKANLNQSADVCAKLTVNQGPDGVQWAERQQDVNINLTSENSKLLQNEILPSHPDVSADPMIFLQSSHALTMPTAQNSLLPGHNIYSELSEANKTDSLTSTLEGDLQMQSQDGKNNKEKYSRPSIVTTADDWENIQTIEPGFIQSGDRLSGPEPIIESKPLTSFSDSWAYFKAADYTLVKDKIKVQVERHGLSALKHVLFGPPKLHRDLLPQRELLFCVAATPFDNSSESHNRILQTIYRCLTGSRFDCQRFGSHWEEIGFQGKDPATDLRGTGMLSLLHLLHFLQSPSTKDLARDVYKLSLHPTQNFPFCIMSINLSRISLQAVREDVYNKECNRSKDVINTVNNIYTALFLHLYIAWKKGKTIMDSGFVIQEIEIYVRKHSKDIFKEMKAYEQAKKQHGQSRKDSDAEPIFLNVCKEDKS